MNTSATFESICRLALHPTTPKGEWQAASIAFFRLHRRAGTSPLDQPSRQEQDDFALWFGKYKGMQFSEIIEENSSYAVWLFQECKTLNPMTRARVGKMLSRRGLL